MLPKTTACEENGKKINSNPINKRAIIDPNRLIAFTQHLRESNRKTTRLVPANHASRLISLRNRLENVTFVQYFGDPEDWIRSRMVAEAEIKKNLIIRYFNDLILHLNQVRIYDNNQKLHSRQQWNKKRKLINKINNTLNDNLNDSDSSIDMEQSTSDLLDISISDLNVSIEDINIEVFDIFQSK